MFDKPSRVATRLASLLMFAVLAVPGVSRADWLDLTDGTWDVTLTCIAGPSPCPSAFHASITISGDGATAFSTTFDNLLFSGDPEEYTGTFDGYTVQKATIVLDPFSFFYLANDVSGPNPFGLSDHWWTYCANISANTCAGNGVGSWTATLVSSAPEPSSLALMAAGLSGLAIVRRRRRLLPA